MVGLKPLTYPIKSIFGLLPKGEEQTEEEKTTKKDEDIESDLLE